MDELISLLIFLYILYRTVADKKHGKKREAPQRRRKPDFGQFFPEKTSGDIEEILGKFFGVEELKQDNSTVSDDHTVQAVQDDRTVKEVEQVKREKPGEKVRKQFLPKRMPQGSNKPVTPGQSIPVQPLVNLPKGSLLREADLKQAVIWSEILQKPKALRPRHYGRYGTYGTYRSKGSCS